MQIQLTFRVDRLVIEHLSVQGRPNSCEVGQIQGGGLRCFWCRNKI
jgi:hypothetical protein